MGPWLSGIHQKTEIGGLLWRQTQIHPYRIKKKTNKSIWTPNLNQLPSDKASCIQKIQKRLKDTNFKKQKDNLNREERLALWKLKRNKDIIVKPADKGSGTVLWDRGAYIQEAEQQLKTEFYRSSSEEEYQHILKIIQNKLSNLEKSNSITASDLKFMTQDNPRPAQFYMLPEIHKNRDKPTVRLIMSGNGHPTETISSWVDQKIQPIMKSLSSYLRDSTHYWEAPILIVTTKFIPLMSFHFIRTSHMRMV